MDESAKVISGLAVSMMLTEEWKSNPLWWQACRLRRIMVLQPTRLPLQKANQQRDGRIDALRRLPKAFGTARRPWSAP